MPNKPGGPTSTSGLNKSRPAPGNDEITLIVPFLRNHDLLTKLVKSIEIQTDKSWQLLIMDDSGSLDPRSLGGLFGDTRTSIIHNTSVHGIPRNWNRGIDAATTNLVAIIHADDELEPTFVTEMKMLMNMENKASVGFCRARIVNEQSHEIRTLVDSFKYLVRKRPDKDGVVRLEGMAGVRRLLWGDWIYCPTMVFNKALLHDIRFPEEWRFATDYAFLFELLQSGHRLVGLDSTLYVYRRHKQSTTETLSRDLSRYFEEHLVLQQLSEKLALKGERRSSILARVRPVHRVQVLSRTAILFILGSRRDALRLLSLAFSCD